MAYVFISQVVHVPFKAAVVLKRYARVQLWQSDGVTHLRKGNLRHLLQVVGVVLAALQLLRFHTSKALGT